MPYAINGTLMAFPAIAARSTCPTTMIAISRASQALLHFIADDVFPCVGAKSAMSQDNMSVVHAHDLRLDDCDAAITAQLQAFAGHASGRIVNQHWTCPFHAH
ncbi:MAG: YqcI/YcgG family protein [Luteimonas sp.]